MKRCPECRRDYFDDSLLYCLDDGAALLEGPGSLSGDQAPDTAILHESLGPSEATTRQLVYTTDRRAATGVQRYGLRTLIAGILTLLVISVGGYAVYRFISSTPKQISSIAVMPFVNESGNPDLDYISDGMTDTLISSLSQIPRLTVKARSAVFRYKGAPTDARAVGQDLGAQAILNGRLVQRGDQMTLKLELIDAQTENVIWAGQYDRKQSDLVAIQNEITRDVVTRLSEKLSGAEEQKLTRTGTSNPEAYRLLLQGRYFLDRTTRDDTDKAIGYFQQALALDPTCALCWADVGRGYAIEGGRAWIPEAEAFDRSRDATKRALSIDPDLPEGHAQLGRIQSTYDLDLRSAEASYRRALELAPSNASVQDGTAMLYYKLGRFDEAISLSRQSLLGDPVNPAFHHNLGVISLAAGQLPESENAFRKALELAPQRIVSDAFLSIVLMSEGRAEEGLTQAQREPDEVWRLWAVAITADRAGKKQLSDEALQKIVSQHANGNAFQIAEIYSVRNEADSAFAWLETAYQKRDSGVTHAKVDLLLQALHSDPRWSAYLKRLGLEV